MRSVLSLYVRAQMGEERSTTLTEREVKAKFDGHRSQPTLTTGMQIRRRDMQRQGRYFRSCGPNKGEEVALEHLKVRGQRRQHSIGLPRVSSARQ